MKAVLHYRASPGFRRALEAAAEAAGVRAVVVEEGDDEGLGRHLADAEILLHVLRPVTREMIKGAPRLKLIQKIGVGVNTIDLEAARAGGVAVCNMPGSNSAAVAEMALALMFAVLRRIVWLDARTREGEGWSLELEGVDAFGEIGGRAVGLIGFGASAQRLAPVLEALGARLLYAARRPDPRRPEDHRSLEDLLGEADIVSLHLPLTDETRGLMNAEAFARMRPSSILINTARGELVDEAALGAALRDGRLAGAGLDVFAREPVGGGHPLSAFTTVVMTPHVAWLTPETLRRSLAIAMANALRLADGAPLLHRIV